MRIRETAFDIGRAIGRRPIASRLFCLVERALPLERVGRSAQMVAFRHPRPSWDPHILVVPTTAFPELATPSLSASVKSALLWEMTTLARSIIDTSLAPWQLIINGGQRQDIGQVHGHLFHASGDAAGPAWELADPDNSPDGWTRLFDRVQQAAKVPSNGYSVTFSFEPGDRLVATFSEIPRS